jgi:hypothetical protein
MILGVYWAFKFTEKIYSFDYFKYRGTAGGHAHSPSELYMDCKVENPDLFVDGYYPDSKRIALMIMDGEFLPRI